MESRGPAVMEIFYKMSRLVDFDELWSKQVSVVFFNENEGSDLIQHVISKGNCDRVSIAVQAYPVFKLSHLVVLLALKMSFLCEKRVISKGNLNWISIAVQAYPVFKPSHLAVFVCAKLWFSLKSMWFWKVVLINVVITFENYAFFDHFEV